MVMATETLRDFCGSHGRYTFYRTLLYDDVANNRRQLKIGDFVRIRFEQGLAIPKARQLYTAEVQLFWTETRNPYRLASVRIYYPPAYLPVEENDSSLFGRDELLSLPEKVVLKVEDLIRCIKAAPQADDFVIMSYNEYCRHQACLRMYSEKFGFSCTSWRRNSCNCILNSRLADKRVYFCRREHDFDQLDELKIRCDELAPSLRGRKRYRQERPKGYKKYLLTVSSSPAQLGGWQVNSKANRADGGPEQKRLRRTARLRCTELSTPINRVERPKHISPYQTRQRERVSSQTAAKKRRMPNLARRSFRRMANTATKKRASPTAEQNHKLINDVDTSEPHNGVKRKRGRPRKNPLPVASSALEVDVSVKAPCTKTVDDDERPPSASADHFSSSMEQSPAATGSSSAASSGEEQKRPRKCVEKTQHSNESSLQILPEYSDEKKQFLRSLIAFMDSIGEPLRKEPSLYYTAVDVHDLYKICIGYGGFDNVCKKRLWRSVYRQLGGTSKNAAVSSYLKRIYQRDLLRFEAHERRDGAMRADSVATSLDADSTNSNSNSDEPEQPGPGGSPRKAVRNGSLPFRHDANLPDELANGFAPLEDRPIVHVEEPNGVNRVELTCKGHVDKLRKSEQASPIVRSVSRTPQVSRSASRSSSDVRNSQTKLTETPIASLKHESLSMPVCANANGNGSVNGEMKSERCNSINAQQLTATHVHALPALLANHTNHTAPNAGTQATAKPSQEFCRPGAQPAAVNLPLFSGMHLPGLSLSSLSNFTLPSNMDNAMTQQAHCVAPQWLLSPPPNGAGMMTNNHTAPLHLAAPNFNVTSLLDHVNLHPAFPIFCSPAAYQIPLPLLGLLPAADSFNGTLSLPALQNMAMPPGFQLTAAHGNGMMNQMGMAPLFLSNGINASNPSVHIDPVVEYLKLLIMNAHAGFNNGAMPQPHALSQQPLRLDQAVLNPRTANSQLLLPRPSGSAHPRAHMTEFEST